MGQYERIARAYNDRSKKYPDPIMERVYQFWLNACEEAIDGLAGKKILDVACGTGRSSRLLAKKKADVTGIEREQAMLDVAIEEEDVNSLGIKYFQGEWPCDTPAELEKFSFDLVTGAHLLHYAKSREELFGMLKEIFRFLKPGGRFVGINSNPWHPVSKNGFKLFQNENHWIEEPWSEGSRLKLKLTNVGNNNPIQFHWWSYETYEEAFLKAGLSCPIFWRIKNFSGEKAKEIENDISLVVITALKPEE